jgi:hypothetical protein
MSYVIYTSSGTILTTIPNGKFNTATTSLTLVGRDVLNYGKYINQNLVYLLSNFADSTTNPPSHPITGQLWYDTTAKAVKVYQGSGFVTIGSARVNTAQPVGQLPGDFWYDPDGQNLNFMTDTGDYVTVTTFPIENISGWKYPLTPIYDNATTVRDVTLLRSHGEVTGVLTTASFTVSKTDSTGTFVRAATTSLSVVNGLTIIGDIKATGNLHINSSTAISLATLKSVVASSVSFADFQTKIAAL